MNHGIKWTMAYSECHSVCIKSSGDVNDDDIDDDDVIIGSNIGIKEK